MVGHALAPVGIRGNELGVTGSRFVAQAKGLSVRVQGFGVMA